jgi:integrase/recombinase XerD
MLLIKRLYLRLGIESYINSYQSHLRIERGFQKIPSVLFFDIERLCLYLNQNEIAVSPILIDDVTIQQFVYELASQVNSRSQARIISGSKSFFNYLILKTMK